MNDLAQIRIYNSMTRKIEVLTPVRPGRIGIYVCGVTVYDDCHLGHARMLLTFDVVVRYLRYRGYRVNYVRNITDIDDKIIRRAAENRESTASLTERYIARLKEDEQALGIVSPNSEPRATSSMPAIITMIARLIERDYAYKADNGDVYYRVSRFTRYGRLSGRRVNELRAGVRIEVEAGKEDPLDFALWKAARVGEPSWSAPWGQGRPGWHIECSAMSTEALGDHFDIHGGGLDLKFPHHENEIAQTEAATGQPFANVWMHNGFVEVEQEKMAKSLGNFVTIRDLLALYPGETLRFFILSSHYRSPLAYSVSRLGEAHSALSRLYLALNKLPVVGDDHGEGLEEYRSRFHAAMDEDFNTPEALAVLFEITHEINRIRASDPHRAAALARILKELAAPLGILQSAPDQYLRNTVDTDLTVEDIELRIAERTLARKVRDFGKADRIRDELAESGVILEDSANGTTWRRG